MLVFKSTAKENVILKGGSSRCPQILPFSFTVAFDLMKRLPEAGCRPGFPPGCSEHRCFYKDTSEPADMLSPSPGTHQRGGRDTQSQAFGTLPRDLLAASTHRQEQGTRLPGDV